MTNSVTVKISNAQDNVVHANLVVDIPTLNIMIHILRHYQDGQDGYRTDQIVRDLSSAIDGLKAVDPLFKR